MRMEFVRRGRHGPSARADYNKTYRKRARMEQITGLLDFIDEHVDQHGVSVVQILTQVGGDIR